MDGRWSSLMVEIAQIIWAVPGSGPGSAVAPPGRGRKPSNTAKARPTLPRAEPPTDPGLLGSGLLTAATSRRPPSARPLPGPRGVP
jgi:hypothetical protein